MRSYVVALALCLLSSVATSPAWAQSAPSESGSAAKARAHFERGVELHAAGDISGTLAEFERAYELRPSPLLAFHIGRVAFELRRFARSYRAFVLFVQTDDATTSAEKRSEAERMVSTLASRIAHVQIESNEPGARLSLDEEPIGEIPLPEPLILDVGSHEVRVSKSGFIAVTRVLTLAGGDDVKLQIELEPVEPPRSLPAVASATAAAIASERDRVAAARPLRTRISSLVWTGIAATGALSISATLTGIYALRASADLDRTRFTGPSAGADFDHDAKRVRRLSVASDVLLGAALVSGGATLFWIWRTHHATKVPNAKPGMRATLRPDGLSIEGRF